MNMFITVALLDHHHACHMARTAFILHLWGTGREGMMLDELYDLIDSMVDKLDGMDASEFVHEWSWLGFELPPEAGTPKNVADVVEGWGAWLAHKFN